MRKTASLGRLLVLLAGTKDDVKNEGREDDRYAGTKDDNERQDGRRKIAQDVLLTFESGAHGSQGMGEADAVFSHNYKIPREVVCIVFTISHPAAPPAPLSLCCFLVKEYSS